MEKIKKMKKNRIFVRVVYTAEGVCPHSVYPRERSEEIEKCSNPRVRLEKFLAWEELRYSVEKYLGIPFESISFSKKENGKWMADKLRFSISHSDGAIAVAVGNVNVGVDIESVRRHISGIERQVFTAKEHLDFDDVPEEERDRHIIKIWTQKESIFKALGKRSFVPREIETSSYRVRTESIELNGKEFMLSVFVPDGETDVHYEIIK